MKLTEKNQHTIKSEERKKFNLEIKRINKEIKESGKSWKRIIQSVNQEKLEKQFNKCKNKINFTLNILLLVFFIFVFFFYNFEFSFKWFTSIQDFISNLFFDLFIFGSVQVIAFKINKKYSLASYIVNGIIGFAISYVLAHVFEITIFAKPLNSNTIISGTLLAIIFILMSIKGYKKGKMKVEKMIIDMNEDIKNMDEFLSWVEKEKEKEKLDKVEDNNNKKRIKRKKKRKKRK